MMAYAMVTEAMAADINAATVAGLVDRVPTGEVAEFMKGDRRDP